MSKSLDRRAVLAGLGTALAVPSWAQESWPTRPVKIVVPYPAGGGSDLAARPWAERLGAAFGQSFVVDNRGGASGTIGTEAVARAPADGYTLLFTPNSAMSIVPQLRKVGYDPRKDFVPVARVGDQVAGFVIRADTGIKTMAEMVAYAKQNPGKLAYGGGGYGTTTQLRLEMLKLRAGIDILYVAYRGNVEAMQDVLAGTIQMTNDISTLPHVKAGTLRLLAVSHARRHPDFPDVPTLTEAGFPGMDVPLWQGLYAPAATPRAIVEKLNAKVRELASTEEMMRRMRAISVEVPLQTTEEMAKFLVEDYEANGKVIREANIKLE